MLILDVYERGYYTGNNSSAPSISLSTVNSDFYYLGESFLLNHTSERCFYIAILGDDVPEVEEELRVVLLTISDGFIIRTVIATVVIRDDDGE